MFDGVTGVDKTKPESVVNLLGGNARLVFLAATVLLLAGGGLLFWLLESAVSGAAAARGLLKQRLCCHSRCCHAPCGPPPPLYLLAQWPLSWLRLPPDTRPACLPACGLLQGTPLAAKMLYAAIFMGYCYQGPPFRCAAAACLLVSVGVRGDVCGRGGGR